MENTTEQKPWTPEVGDVCALKSGGPQMTVTNVIDPKTNGAAHEGEPLVECSWFLPIESGRFSPDIHKHSFKLAALKELNQ